MFPLYPLFCVSTSSLGTAFYEIPFSATCDQYGYVDASYQATASNPGSASSVSVEALCSVLGTWDIAYIVSPGDETGCGSCNGGGYGCICTSNAVCSGYGSRVCMVLLTPSPLPSPLPSPSPSPSPSPPSHPSTYINLHIITIWALSCGIYLH